MKASLVDGGASTRTAAGHPSRPRTAVRHSRAGTHDDQRRCGTPWENSDRYREQAVFTRMALVKHAWVLTVSARSQRGTTAEEALVTRPRQVILWIVVIFIIYAIYNNPAKSADAVHAIWNVLVSAVDAIFRFFDDLINRR